jgi:putative hydrolase
VPTGGSGHDPVGEALDRVVYLLDRSLAPRQKVRAFRRAIDIVAETGADEIARRARDGALTDLDGIGPSTASVIADAALDGPGEYLAQLERTTRLDVGMGGELRSLLRGDCHSHTTWSDGGADIATMARTAMALGHEYLVITDHSPRLTIAHGLTPERLAEQLAGIAVLNEFAPFRILTGMEVDILEDGSGSICRVDARQLDVVVASVHSKLDAVRPR